MPALPITGTCGIERARARALETSRLLVRALVSRDLTLLSLSLSPQGNTAFGSATDKQCNRTANLKVNSLCLGIKASCKVSWLTGISSVRISHTVLSNQFFIFFYLHLNVPVLIFSSFVLSPFLTAMPMLTHPSLAVRFHCLSGCTARRCRYSRGGGGDWGGIGGGGGRGKGGGGRGGITDVDIRDTICPPPQKKPRRTHIQR